MLKRMVRDGAVTGLYLSGLSGVRRRWRRARGPLARVLCFHRIGSIERFRGKLELLIRDFEVVRLRDVVENRGLSRSRTNVALTFDDVFPDELPAVTRALTDASLPATFFVPSSAVDLPPAAAAAFYRDRVGIPSSEAPSAETLRELVDSALFEVGSHTRTHADLGRTIESAKLRDEIGGSRRDLEAVIGREVDLFAYPFGDVVNHSAAAIDTLRDAGYVAALTIVPGFNVPDTPRFEMHRDSLDPAMPDVLFRAWLDGAYDLPKAVLNRRKRAR